MSISQTLVTHKHVLFDQRGGRRSASAREKGDDGNVILVNHISCWKEESKRHKASTSSYARGV